MATGITHACVLYVHAQTSSLFQSQFHLFHSIVIIVNAVLNPTMDCGFLSSLAPLSVCVCV